MKLSYKISIVVGLLLVVGVFVYLNGWISGDEDTHPPCEQLPSVEEADEALNNNKDLSEEIKKLGEGITVEVGRPCSDYENKGLVEVKYDSKEERNSISNLLNKRNGFGVPVYLVEH